MEHDENYYKEFQHKNGYWYYYVYRDGKRVRRSTGQKRHTNAKLVIENRIKAGDILSPVGSKKSTKFKVYAEPFYDYDQCPIIQDKIKRGGHYSHELAKGNLWNKNKYLVSEFGDKELTEITVSMVNAWLLSLEGKYGISSETANKQLTILRQILDVAVSDGVISSNPARAVKPLVPKEKERGCFTHEQIEALFTADWDDVFIRAMCRLAAATGMRLGEIRGLHREQLHENYIMVDRSYNDEEKIKTTKSGKPRYVALRKDVLEEILSLPTSNDLIFSYNGKVPIHKKTITAKLRAQMEKVGIDYRKDNLTFHSFRHYCNTRLVVAGVEPTLIRSMMGHASQSMTDRYAHPKDEFTDRVIAVQNAMF